MQQSKPFTFNIQPPIRTKEYTPISPSLDYSHPNYLYEGNKYRTHDETSKLLFNEQIVGKIYGICYKESLLEVESSDTGGKGKRNGNEGLLGCYKEKLAIFRDIIQVLNEKKEKNVV